ncbi:hypothetical protein MalM25_02540 [Planctomycetes bacterium MalM25]|nr:hypothetical protein MalM25_02540 [Planctomycetes bacterium MalM25]
MTKSKIAGWILSLLIAALLLGPSATSKLTEWEGKAEAFAKLGYAVETMTRIGYVEVLVTLLFLIPRTSFVGAILLTGYLGGATASHVRIDEPWFMPVAIGVLAWVALGLRRAGVFPMALGAAPAAPPAADAD